MAIEVELVRSKHGPSYIARFHGRVNRIDIEGELVHPIHYGIGETAMNYALFRILYFVMPGAGSIRREPVAWSPTFSSTIRSIGTVASMSCFRPESTT